MGVPGAVFVVAALREMLRDDVFSTGVSKLTVSAGVTLAAGAGLVAAAVISWRHAAAPGAQPDAWLHRMQPPPQPAIAESSDTASEDADSATA